MDNQYNTEVMSVNAMNSVGISQEIYDNLLELQLKMATSSINHEYARLEYEDSLDNMRRAELIDYMNSCHTEYFTARQSLSNHDPCALKTFEANLLKQKMSTISTYSL